MADPLQAWYMETPVITRVYCSACFLTTVACQLDLVTPFHLYFNLDLIVNKQQWWRFITNFFYFAPLGLDFVFHMFFLYRYSKLLEAGSFRNRTADYFYLLLLGALFMTSILVLVDIHVLTNSGGTVVPANQFQSQYLNIYFLGSSLNFMLVYIWGRRNPSHRLGLLGLGTFSAPYLPWVLLLLSVLLGHNPIPDIMGILAGHIYYFMEDVYSAPKPRGLGGPRVLVTPYFITWLFEGPSIDSSYETAPERGQGAGGYDFGGGGDWGEGVRVGEGDHQEED